MRRVSQRRRETVYLNRADFADIIAAQTVLIELKAVERILPVHEAQTRTCLRRSGCELALLMNFDAPRLQDDDLHRRIP